MMRALCSRRLISRLSLAPLPVVISGRFEGRPELEIEVHHFQEVTKNTMSMGRPRFDPRQQQRGFQIRVNHRIRVPEVRVIDADGAMLGVLQTHEALRMAQEQGLDLVEVNPKAEPPVCKILDFGKYKYEEKKKAAEAKRKQTVVEIKEIKLRPKTDDHDIDFKIKAARRFLEAGHKVKFTVRFRGREITHPEKAQEQLTIVIAGRRGPRERRDRAR